MCRILSDKPKRSERHAERNAWIRDMVASGKSIEETASFFGLGRASIWEITKELRRRDDG